ncbi:hypothetical protein G6O69_31090 [Pseudenhygromyxa sp. WMMC2535]|uniref:hypothetical protein n=1 Tax=Pseudenhygromyxa sp. WMMC2535 TaxID=2712867 RepID=UPI00155744AD|nr:hypothetical protein [Pseudenhygromyxa sp. WMMC2535]NVB42310.1 hypothetical protein [Pseudenhygromyxa sp. WMMC2535]
MPFFHRLQTTHSIGLNQARSTENLDSFIRKIMDPKRAHAATRVLKGSLREDEADVLCDLLTAISNNYDAYLSQLQL